MLTSAEIAQARADLALMLVDSVAIRRRTVLSDGAGGTTDTWSTLATVAGKLDPTMDALSAEREVVSRLGLTSPAVIKLPALTDVTASDRLQVLGVEYEVAYVAAPRTWELTRRVLVERVS